MGYRPISEYGVVGNDDRVALIHRDGSVDWCCFPHVAAPSAFGRLLDAEDGGHFAVQPTGSFEAEQRYVEHTNVLETTFETKAGRATLTDFMPIGSDERPPEHQRALYRRLDCEEGFVTVEVDFAPRLDYARTDTIVERDDDADGIVATGAGEALHLQTIGPLDVTPIDPGGSGGRAVGSATFEAGQTLWLVLQHDHVEARTAQECAAIERETVAHWQDWVDGVEERVTAIAGDEPWLDAVIRSGLVLQLLINEGTGGIYAAATTSLPEAYGGDRNWDYRYNWIRDSKFAVQALYNLGQTDAAHRYFEWFREVSHEDPEAIKPMYGVHGERELEERVLDHLDGYRFSSPVRVGNAAAEQRQLDIYGTIVQGVYETLAHDERLSDRDWASIEAIVDHVCDVWSEPGEGMWEFRQEPKQYVHSKLLCWVALDRGIELAEHRDGAGDLERWREERAAIREAIEERGYSESAGSFVQHFETDEVLDATCLLVPIYEFLPADDERVQRTIDAVCEELLTDHGLVRRTSASDAHTDDRGAFLLCSFWLVDALVLAGRVDQARDVFTDVLDRVDEPVVLPERVDPRTSEFLGNYPQAFSHIGLLNSAVYLASASKDDGLEHDPLEDLDVQPLFRSRE